MYIHIVLYCSIVSLVITVPLPSRVLSFERVPHELPYCLSHLHKLF